MYGTVARLKLKAGSEAKFLDLMKEYEVLKIPGHLSSHVFRLDAGGNEYIMTAVFADKASYTKNAQDPAQDARYRKMRDLLESDPAWHDGEVIYSG